jgi:putative ATP-binding cassette transporter
MNLIRFLLGYSRRTLQWTLATAALGGACNAGLIAMVNAVLNGVSWPRYVLIWGFVALGLGRLVSNYLAQTTLAVMSQESTANLRRDLIRKVLSVPLREVEEIGSARLMASLTGDIMNIAEALRGIPTMTVNIAILVGGALYLGWLSPKVLIAMGAFILIGAAIYRVLIKSAWHHIVAGREQEDRLFGNFRALTEGIKELKLHRERRGVFLTENVQATTEACQRHNIAAEKRFIIAQNWTHLLFFTLIGLILFVLPRWESVDPHAMTGYVVATLYLMGPLSGLLGGLSLFGRAGASLRKIEQLGLTLDSQASDDAPLTGVSAAKSFKRLDLIDVTHAYHVEKEDSQFLLGPINLTFRPGEIVFLVGGNGSGKSSLAKVITGLYPPAGGEIRLDGQIIGNKTRDDYRQYFSAVFADFYLFDNLLGLERPNLDAQARGYLSQLHLDHKVKIRNGALSTTQLSQGQRKRLALLTAYLEDRPFYLFDEWASDQDPVFKDLFYTQLLPELRSRNKAVLVITHDDRYFHLADRVIKLDYGQIASESSTTSLADNNLSVFAVPAPAAR